MQAIKLKRIQRIEQDLRQLGPGASAAEYARVREEAEEVLPPALFAALFGADVDGPTIVRALTAAVEPEEVVEEMAKSCTSASSSAATSQKPVVEQEEAPPPTEMVSEATTTAEPMETELGWLRTQIAAEQSPGPAVAEVEEELVRPVLDSAF